MPWYTLYNSATYILLIAIKEKVFFAHYLIRTVWTIIHFLLLHKTFFFLSVTDSSKKKFAFTAIRNFFCLFVKNLFFYPYF